ncbi:MAG: hypothetical protein JO299_07915 [Gammaproteobacteria bacterium]|nr:hypothetical protein [Gammaproteobacteria bacterium]
MGIPLLPSAKHIPAAAHIQHQSVLTFLPEAARNGRPVTPRLRLDRVALRLVESLRVALAGVVPEGRTVALTITAPIRQAAKTATAIEGQIRLRLRRRSLGRSAHSIHENSVQIWVLKGGTALTSKLVGFVHNPDVDPAALIELTAPCSQRWIRSGAQPRQGARRGGCSSKIDVAFCRLRPIRTSVRSFVSEPLTARFS